MIIIGRNAKAVAKAAKEIGRDTLGLVADVSRVGDIARAFQTIGERADHIDVLFANAGIAKFLPFAEVTEEFFVETIAANVNGVYFTIQKAAGAIRRSFANREGCGLSCFGRQLVRQRFRAIGRWRHGTRLTAYE